MERTATHYRVRDYGVTLLSRYYADCQFFRKEIVMAMLLGVWLWDSILVMQLSMTLELAADHFEVMCEKNVLLPWNLNFRLT